MSHEVFVDASAWIAISDRRDKYYTMAGETYTHLIRARRIFVTTNLVIAESYTLIRRTGGHAPAVRWLSSLRGSPRLVRVYSDGRLETLAEEILEKYADQDYSFTDAVSFVVMREREIEEALAFDRHFTSMGFRLLPGDGL